MIFITDVKELSHMCGIVGYIGNRQAAPILLDGLAKLEYRGYDSAGIAVYNDGGIDMIKSKGRLKVLSELTAPHCRGRWESAIRAGRPTARRQT